MSEEIIQNSTDKQAVVKEIIGRYSVVDTSGLWRTSHFSSLDNTQTDYRFYDNLRNGQAAGFRLSGLFAPTITTTLVSHIWGEGVTAYLNENIIKNSSKSNIKYTNELLGRFMKLNAQALITMNDDLYSLGDQYIVVNIDGSLSVPSPDTVEVKHNIFDYRRADAYIITTKTIGATFTDEYRANSRILRIKLDNSPNESVFTFPNLIGVIPVVHFKNNARSNELFGRPIVEPLLRLLERYDALLEKALDGVELIGNPIPTFEGLEDIQATINANRSDVDGSYEDQFGDPQERVVLHFDRMAAVFVGKGGSFKFAGPLVGFSSDVLAMLKHLFQLAMNYSRLPEYVFGGAVSSSKASVETQQPPFNQYIRGRRIMLEGAGEDEEVGSVARGGLFQLLDIFLRIKRLTNPKIVVGPAIIKWPELSIADEQIRFNWIKYLTDKGYIEPVETLDQSNMVDNPEEVWKKAQEAFPKVDDFGDKLNTADQAADLPLDNESNNSNPRASKVNNEDE